MKTRVLAFLATGLMVVAAACGGDDTAAQLAERERQIAELEQQLADATSTTSTMAGETPGTTGAGTGTSTAEGPATTTTLPPGVYAVAEIDTCVIGSAPGQEVNLRAGPGSDEALVGTLAGDATGVRTTGWASLDGGGQEWRQILHEDGTAWAFSTFLTPGECPVGPPAGYCVNEAACTDTPNVRTGPGGAYSIIGTLAADAVAIVGTGASTLDDRNRPWVQIRYEEGAGWVAGWLLDQEPCTPTECPPPPLPWTITADTVGPIELGMPITALGTATGFTWAFEEPGAVGCLAGTAAGLGVGIIAHAGALVDEINVYERDDAVTAAGMRVGDSLAEVQAAYGSRVLEITDDGYAGTAVWIDVDGDGEADLVALISGSTVRAIRLPAVLSEGCL
jgi:uncharacterized protein YraI